MRRYPSQRLDVTNTFLLKPWVQTATECTMNQENKLSQHTHVCRVVQNLLDSFVRHHRSSSGLDFLARGHLPFAASFIVRNAFIKITIRGRFPVVQNKNAYKSMRNVFVDKDGLEDWSNSNSNVGLQYLRFIKREHTYILHLSVV